VNLSAQRTAEHARAADGARHDHEAPPLKRHTTRSEFDVSGLTALPQVDVLYSYVQPSPALVPALMASGVRGIVFAGSGAGDISPIEREALKPLLSLPASSRPVLVRSSRTGNGRVLARPEYDSAGMVPADNLSPQKARILLMLALTRTHDLSEIRRMFAEY